MSVFIKYDAIEPGRAVVTLQYFQTEDLSKETLATGVLVESIPAPDPALLGQDKFPVLMYNPDTGGLWYEYQTVQVVQIPAELEMEELKQQVRDMQLALNTMMLGGGV